MPVTAAIITGGATIGGSIVGGKGQAKAAKIQGQTADRAIAFQREQAAKAEAAYRAQWDQWQASRNELMQRYGIDIAPPVAPARMERGPTTSPGGPDVQDDIDIQMNRGGGAPAAVPPPAAGGPPAGPGTLGTIATGPPPGPPTGTAMAPELGSWNDWHRLGLRR